jgi:uncharacterized lipoprotein YajG
MQEQLITLETAKLAKEKDFNCKQYLSLDNENPKNLNSNYNPARYQPWFYNITQSLLQKWLREKHDIEIYVRSSVDLYNKKYWTTFLPNGCLENKNNTYEEALEIGLQEALKLI